MSPLLRSSFSLRLEGRAARLVELAELVRLLACSLQELLSCRAQLAEMLLAIPSFPGPGLRERECFRSLGLNYEYRRLFLVASSCTFSSRGALLCAASTSPAFGSASCILSTCRAAEESCVELLRLYRAWP